MTLGLAILVACRSERPGTASTAHDSPSQLPSQSRRSAALERAETLNARGVAEQERERCQSQGLQLYKFNMDLQTGGVTASCGIPFVITDANELRPPLSGADITARTEHPAASSDDCPALFEKLQTEMGQDGSVELHAPNGEGEYRVLCRRAGREGERVHK